jgi:hypothetical protein
MTHRVDLKSSFDGQRNHNFDVTNKVTIESAAQRSASKTAQAILSGKYNKRLKEENNIDDFIEVRDYP